MTIKPNGISFIAWSLFSINGYDLIYVYVNDSEPFMSEATSLIINERLNIGTVIETSEGNREWEWEKAAVIIVGAPERLRLELDWIRSHEAPHPNQTHHSERGREEMRINDSNTIPLCRQTLIKCIALKLWRRALNVRLGFSNWLLCHTSFLPSAPFSAFVFSVLVILVVVYSFNGNILRLIIFV